MATAKPKAEEVNEEKIDRGEEYVDFMIPRTGPEDAPQVIGVNGSFIRVQPGVQVRVKRKFVEAWEHAQEQKNAAWRAQVKRQEASRKALADL